MGRTYRTRSTTGEVTRIELRWMLDNGYFKPGGKKHSIMNWSNGSTISVKAANTEEELSLQLYYTITNSSGEKESLSYTIDLVETPSNLGKGKLLFFICPETGKKCRILYKAYGSPIFKSRGSYSYKLYYEIQTSSKLYLHTTRYFTLDKRLEKLYKMRKTYTYKGVETKRARLIKRLEEKLDEEDFLRWKAWDVRLKTELYS